MEDYRAMSLEVGSIVEGVITGITSYGAFVRLPEGNTGLVHISEVADTYVEDIHNFLREKDTVTVKVMGINNKGKYDLSIKQAKPQQSPTAEKPQKSFSPPPSRPVRPKAEPVNNEDHESQIEGDFRESRPSAQFKPRGKSFEDMMGRFMKESEERLSDLKRNTDTKKGRNKGR